MPSILTSLLLHLLVFISRLFLPPFSLISPTHPEALGDHPHLIKCHICIFMMPSLFTLYHYPNHIIVITFGIIFFKRTICLTERRWLIILLFCTHREYTGRHKYIGSYDDGITGRNGKPIWQIQAWLSALICSGCNNNIPQTGWLKQKGFICSQFWKLKVQDQVLAFWVLADGGLLCCVLTWPLFSGVSLLTQTQVLLN